MVTQLVVLLQVQFGKAHYVLESSPLQSQVPLQFPAYCVHGHVFENDTTLIDLQPDRIEVKQRFNKAQ